MHDSYWLMPVLCRLPIQVSGFFQYLRYSLSGLEKC